MTSQPDVTPARVGCGGDRQADRLDLSSGRCKGPPHRGHAQSGARRHPGPDGYRCVVDRHWAGQPVCSGHLALTDKAYAATIRLGLATVTDDAEGEVTETPGARGVTDDQIASALERLRASTTQVPSSVSAIKIDGVRSYAKVRSGQDVVLAPRPVIVDRLEVVARRDVQLQAIAVVDLDVVVECSSGCYVRALARDLGIALGTGGHLTALRRTRVGPFMLDEAQAFDTTTSNLTVLDMADVARRCFASVTVDPAQVIQVRNGRQLPQFDLPANPTALLSPEGTLLALYRPRAGGGAIAEAVFSDSSVVNCPP